MDIENFLKTLGVGRRSLDDPFLDNTHKHCKVFERKGVSVEDEEELCHKIVKEFPCNACNQTFQSVIDYELHYHDCHHFVCSECKQRRPTSRLLEIHIQETHDSFFTVLSNKQPMYQCFVSECDVKFKDQAERTEHCRQVHGFPKNYRFDKSTNKKPIVDSEDNARMEIVDNKLNKSKAPKIFKKKNKPIAFAKQNFNLQPTMNLNTNKTVEETKLTPVTMFVPRQVQQKSYARTLTNNQQMERNVLESKCLMELEEALPTS